MFRGKYHRLQYSVCHLGSVGILLVSLFLLTACKQDSSGDTAPASGPGGGAATTSSGIRIISTVPAATAQLLQLGAADLLVGVTKYDQPILPPGKEDLPVVGDYDSLNYELLIKLHPTVLVMQRTASNISGRLEDIIARHHIELVNIKLDVLADLYATAAELGRVSGHASAAATTITATRQTLATIQNQWAAAPHPRVVYLVGTSPMMVAGSGTFIHEVLQIAGAVNAGATIGSNYPTISNEALINMAPDVLLIAAPGEPPSTGVQDPRLARLIDLPIAAARQGRIYLITDPNCQLATLTIAEQVRALARLIHQADPPSAPTPAATLPAAGKVPP